MLNTSWFLHRIYFLLRITNDKAEDQMEKNLAGVSNHLGGLKAIAEGMNTSVSKQNNQIDRMNKKVSSQSQSLYFTNMN